jgi:hypothetical protein
VNPILNPCCSNPRAQNLPSPHWFTASRAQLRSWKASSASSTAVEGENETGASPQRLVVDPDPRSKPPVVARSQLEPTLHKVSKNWPNSSLQCHRINRQPVWCSRAHKPNYGELEPVSRWRCRSLRRFNLRRPLNNRVPRLEVRKMVRRMKSGPHIAS